MSWIHVWHRARHDERGAITIFIAFAIITLIGAAGLAFEMSRYTQAKARFNNALDQAVLAAAASNAPDPQAYGAKFFESNMQANQAGVTINTVRISADANRQSWTGSATGTLATILGKFIGISQLELAHEAVVGWDPNRKTEIVAMVDVSGTMCAKFERTALQDGSTAIDINPDPSCRKLNDMKLALREIVKTGVGISGAPNNSGYKAGIVPYTFKVKVANPAAIPAFVTAGEVNAGYGGDYYTNFADAEGSGPPLPPVTPLTQIRNQTDKDAFIAKITQLSTPTNAEIQRPFMKRSSVGGMFSGLMLDPDYTSIFGGAQPLPFGKDVARKIVILMTDSANLGCCFTNWPADNFRNNYVYSYAPDHQALVGGGGQKGLCETMKERGVEIFTVLLDVDRRDMDERGHEIVDSYNACASSGQAYEIPYGNQAALKDAYDKIGKAIMSLKLLK